MRHDTTRLARVNMTQSVGEQARDRLGKTLLIAAVAVASMTGVASGQTLVENGSFDRYLDGWEYVWWFDTFGASWSGDDAAGSPSSGSAILVAPGNGGRGEEIALTYYQGIPVLETWLDLEPNRNYELRARVRGPVGRTAAVGASIWVSWHQVGCSTNGALRQFSFPIRTGEWTEAIARFRTPEEVDCSGLYLGLTKQPYAGPDVGVQFDDVSIRALAEHEYLVPGIAHAPGEGEAQWKSDLTVFNPGPAPALVELTFSGNATLGPVQRTVAVRQQLAFDDVLSSAFGIDGEDIGVIAVNSDEPVEVHARTYSSGPDPTSGGVMTVGQFFPGLAASQALLGTEIGFITGLRSDGAYRSNLEFVNAGTEEATVAVRFFDSDGAEIGAPLTRALPVGRRVGVIAALPPGHSSAFAEIHLRPLEARVIAFGSVIDGVSNDPTTIPVTTRPAEMNGFGGTWTGTVEWISEARDRGLGAGCGADYLRTLVGEGGTAQVTITGRLLTVDAIPAGFGQCAPVELEEEYGSIPVRLSCDFGLPRDVTCPDGTTVRLTLEGVGEGASELGFSESQLRFGYNPTILTLPGDHDVVGRLSPFFIFQLDRAP